MHFNDILKRRFIIYLGFVQNTKKNKTDFLLNIDFSVPSDHFLAFIIKAIEDPVNFQGF